jgi:hypothetical protein
MTVGCGTGLTSCNGNCVNETNDATNCGACGKTCTAGIACTASHCVVRDGYTTPYSSVANNSGDYVFCMAVSVPYAITVTALAAITIGSGGTFVMGLYASSGTVPTGAPIVVTAPANSAGTVQELPVTPTAIGANTYWVCASASAAGADHWGYTSANSDFAVGYTYTGSMPNPMPTGMVYPNDTLNFYLVGYE